MSVKSVELRKQAVAINEQVAELLKNETRSKEDNTKIDKMLADADVQLIEAKRLEASEKIVTENRTSTKTAPEARIETREQRSGYETKAQREERQFNERRAFCDFILGDANEEAVKYIKRDYTDTGRRKLETRAEAAISSPITDFTANASFLVPQGFQYELEVAMKAYGNLLGDCRVVDTASGQPLYWPTENDTAQKAHSIGESQPVSENDLTLSHVLFGAWKYTADVVRISLELEQDSFESIENIVKDAFGVRWGRGLNNDFTVGDGNQKCTGILTAVGTSRAVVAVGSAANDGSGSTGQNSIGYYDYVNLIHSVDPAYRNRPKTRFMFHDQVLQSARRLLDKYGRPLWMPGMSANAPDTILGYAYSINQQMPLGTVTSSPLVTGVIAPGNTTIVFGDLSKFIIRRIKEMSVMRLVERYADFGEVGLLSFGRYDSNLVDAGTHPINVLVQAP